jgi:hypothetical protein
VPWRFGSFEVIIAGVAETREKAPDAAATALKPHDILGASNMKLRILLLCAIGLFSAGCSQQNARHSMAPDSNLLGVFDEPRDGAQIKQPFVIAGWAISEDGTEWVGVYVDGEFLGYAKTGMSRPDVHNAFPDKKGSATSGWSFDADPGLFTNGGHRITVDVCSKTGAIYSLGTKSIDIVHSR